MREVIQYGIGEQRYQEIDKRTDALDESQKQIKNHEGITRAITDFAVLTCSMVMLFTGIFLAYNGLLEFEGIIIPTVVLFSSFGPVIALSNLSNNLLQTFASADRVIDLLDEKPQIQDVTNGKDIEFTGVACENIGFSYDEEQILHNVSLTIPQNKIIGINGKSGSGKSTLLKLIMRFWDSNQGSIRISNEDITHINTVSLRNIQSYVTQETYLFDDTIEANIKLQIVMHQETML